MLSLIGEIRDQETADVAIEAANTGHLVLATVHTNDGLEVVKRLLGLGVPTHLLESTLRGVVWQRLERLLCPTCKMEVDPPGDFTSMTGIPEGDVYSRHFYESQPTGCHSCNNTGYQGRAPIIEVLPPNEALMEYIAKVTSDLEAREKAISGMREEGVMLKWNSARILLEKGLISPKRFLEIIGFGLRK